MLGKRRSLRLGAWGTDRCVGVSLCLAGVLLLGGIPLGFLSFLLLLLGFLLFRLVFLLGLLGFPSGLFSCFLLLIVLLFLLLSLFLGFLGSLLLFLGLLASGISSLGSLLLCGLFFGLFLGSLNFSLFLGGINLSLGLICIGVRAVFVLFALLLSLLLGRSFFNLCDFLLGLLLGIFRRFSLLFGGIERFLGPGAVTGAGSLGVVNFLLGSLRLLLFGIQIIFGLFGLRLDFLLDGFLLLLRCRALLLLGLLGFRSGFSAITLVSCGLSGRGRISSLLVFTGILSGVLRGILRCILVSILSGCISGFFGLSSLSGLGLGGRRSWHVRLCLKL